MASAEKPTILLTFDVEDWFQVENLKSAIPRDSWARQELRVVRNTLRVLDLLDSQEPYPKATFFVLGWIARRVPDLVRQIASRGHEVASHGTGHDLMDRISSQALQKDLVASKQLLEDITGQAVTGYRAPSFSIFSSALELIQRAGYRYDSSYNSFGAHGRYGHLDLPRSRNRAIIEMAPGFFEVPVSNLEIKGQILPLGGGGYFRLFPPGLFRLGIRQVLNHQKVFTFYAHPWEFDPGQPRVSGIPAQLKFRHYVNLRDTGNRLDALIRKFSFCRFTTISTHLKGI